MLIINSNFYRNFYSHCLKANSSQKYLACFIFLTVLKPVFFSEYKDISSLNTKIPLFLSISTAPVQQADVIYTYRLHATQDILEAR